MLTWMLVLMVLLPALAAAVAAVVKGALARWVAATVAALVAVLAVWCCLASYGLSYRVALGDLPWLAGTLPAPVFGVLLDPLGCILLLVVTVIGFLTVLYSTRYLSTDNRDHSEGPEAQGRYYFWLLLFLASMVGVAISPNFLQLFIFWEMTTVCSWALISYYGTPKSLAAGFKALVMTAAGGLFFLGAICVLFAKTGSFEFAALGQLPGHWRGAVFVMLMIAAWAKAAQVPFHTWLPDAMEAPTPISAYLHAAAMVKAGVYLIARSVVSTSAVPPKVALLLGAMALLTMFIALSYYFIQDDLKRLLAYSTIANLGYVMLGVALGALGSVTALRGAVLHILCHGFGKATLFLCVGAVAYMTGSRSISALAGVARTMPLTATAFFIGVMAVAGVPPFGCFWSKFMIVAGAMRLPGAIGPVVVTLVLVESLISFAWLLHVAQKVFLGKTTPVACVNSDPPPAMSAVLIVLMLGCLVAPAIGIPLVQWIGR
ncbi:MAG TPA: hydrogenase 4 subunit D [Thermoleophilia bacterium]|nr:hydrogenase 4 subunit D [Thermoleophilia bacterium]